MAQAGDMDGTGHGQLMAGIGRLRDAIARVLADIEHIEQQVNPRIQDDYAVKIGVWDVRLAKAALAARRSKRRLALAQAHANRHEPIDADAIERRLDEELAAWRHRLREQARDIDRMLDRRSRSQPMGAMESREVRHLFRRLARRFHPDLHPGDAERARYYGMAQRALATGDLDTLRAIDVATAGMADGAGLDRLTDDELRLETELLRDQLAACERRRDSVMSSKPYTLRELLDDPEWVSARVGERRARVEAHEAEAAKCDRRYEALVAARGGRDTDGD